MNKRWRAVLGSFLLLLLLAASFHQRPVQAQQGIRGPVSGDFWIPSVFRLIIGDITTSDVYIQKTAAGVASVTGGTFSLPTLLTTGACKAVGSAANPSLVACGSSMSGAFSCATAASTGTCVVSTTAMTASSQLFVTEDETLGTLLGVTCNTSTTVIPTSRFINARTGGTSFTIQLGTVTTNPACFSYLIVN